MVAAENFACKLLLLSIKLSLHWFSKLSNYWWGLSVTKKSTADAQK
jgi:hypothetical protein